MYGVTLILSIDKVQLHIELSRELLVRPVPLLRLPLPRFFLSFKLQRESFVSFFLLQAARKCSLTWILGVSRRDGGHGGCRRKWRGYRGRRYLRSWMWLRVLRCRSVEPFGLVRGKG